jgi:hypothetical protein
MLVKKNILTCLEMNIILGKVKSNVECDKAFEAYIYLEKLSRLPKPN